MCGVSDHNVAVDPEPSDPDLAGRLAVLRTWRAKRRAPSQLTDDQRAEAASRAIVDLENDPRVDDHTRALVDEVTDRPS